MISYAQLTLDKAINDIAIKWEAIDDYTQPLLARDFTHIGDFTTLPLPKLFVGVEACYVDRNGSTLVELQTIQMAPGAVKAGSGSDWPQWTAIRLRRKLMLSKRHRAPIGRRRR